MNYSLALKQLQMAYMAVTMKETEEDQCIYCWKSDCGCGNKQTVKNDPFINLTTMGEFQNA